MKEGRYIGALRNQPANPVIQHVDDRQAVIQEAISKSKRSFLDLLKNPKISDLAALIQECIVFRPEAKTTMRSEIEEKTGAPLQEQLYRDSLEATEKALTVQKKQQLKEQAIKDDKQKKKGWIR